MKLKAHLAISFSRSQLQFELCFKRKGKGLKTVAIWSELCVALECWPEQWADKQTDGEMAWTVVHGESLCQVAQRWRRHVEPRSRRPKQTRGHVCTRITLTINWLWPRVARVVRPGLPSQTSVMQMLQWSLATGKWRRNLVSCCA